jgi:hypothetical protein
VDAKTPDALNRNKNRMTFLELGPVEKMEIPPFLLLASSLVRLAHTGSPENKMEAGKTGTRTRHFTKG